MIDETANATILANKVLDRVNGDPDDDLAVLARQFLRAQCRWRCFHCGEVFVDEEKARDHFGTAVMDLTGCQLNMLEGDMLKLLRDATRELGRYRAEDTDMARAFYALGASHVMALWQEEEKGFARGLDACLPILDAARELLANRHLNVDLSGKVDALAEAVGAYDGKPVG